MPSIITAIIISYLVGSVPTAYIFGKVFKGLDIRKFGSGNVGATNALRVFGKKIGITVLLIDILKGVLPVVFLGNYLIPRAGISPELTRIFLGIACIAGHNWTVFLNFKGGKGVATTLGVLIGFALAIPGFALVLGLVICLWFIVFLIFRIVSLASMMAAVSFPIFMLIFQSSKVMILFSFLLAVLLIVRHRSNLVRIFQGKESRLKFK